MARREPAEHPHRPVEPPRGTRISRRGFLKRSAGAALGLSGAAMLLDACATIPKSVLDALGPPIASPSHPITWPISKDNPPIPSGLEPELNATLKIYNWNDYIYQEVLNNFVKAYSKYNVKIQLSTFDTMDEAMAKLRTGELDFDVFFPVYDRIGELITTGLLRPLTHSYIPNIDQVWPEFQNPFYDQHWRYSVPYTVYTTGIAWRVDKVPVDIAALPNPYDVFWDTRWTGHLEVLDDYRETPVMTLLRNHIYNVNTGYPPYIKRFSTQLDEMAQTTNPLVNVQDYVDLPEAKCWICMAWSGDMINAQYYMPKGQSASVMRYWFPKDGKGPVNNDLISILSSGKNPVMAHTFLNYMLDYKNAMLNMTWNGYQPPQRGVDPDKLVKMGYVPPNLRTAIVRPSDFRVGFRELQLPPLVNDEWESAWEEFKAGG